jgi:hypothetical protein
MRWRLAWLLIGVLCAPASLQAKLWDAPLRGSWLAAEDEPDALILASRRGAADIVVAPEAHTAVRQAARFLARDLQTLSGRKPRIVAQARKGHVAIHLVTAGTAPSPAELDAQTLLGQWESHRIRTVGNALWLLGANPRGTAFAAYTLSERLGIDPLHHWTGYEPARVKVLRAKAIDYEAGEPTFKYRGLFHDDEDTLPEPLDGNGYPQYAGGTIDPVWYERFFETALRLRLNQVAPFTRADRPFAVQQLASDWGLIYTSHHYDILLSNPFGYERFGLAEQRGIQGDYDWSSNRQGIEAYWQAGVEENKDLDVIWPVGLRGTADTAYRFPKGTTQDEKNRVFVSAIRDQVALTKRLVKADSAPVFHFTLYGEMLTDYQTGEFDFPEDVILVWNDTGDGIMRALPEKLGRWQHGIYYHLAYYGQYTKQTHHTVRPDRIEAEFRKIADSGATRYLLLNVSELREHVMNTRFIADISWDAKDAFAESDAASRFVAWWSREYFGKAAAADARAAYTNYFDILHSHDQITQGNISLHRALDIFSFRLRGDHHVHYTLDDLQKLEDLQARIARYDEALATAARAEQAMSPQQQRFFFENLTLGLLMDYYPSRAAALVNQGFRKYPDADALANVNEALAVLEKLEKALARAERPPFQNWYRPTWIRRRDSWTNPHYGYQRVKDYLDSYEPRYQ